MARLNKVPILNHKTHEGAPAKRITWEQQLRRSVCSCMLWEKEFYENGESIAERISEACLHVKPELVADLAIEAREKFKLRHVPLLLVHQLAIQRYKATAQILSQVIQRADELTEFMAIYWRNGKCPISAQVKKGLASAFCKFNAYQLAKYNRDTSIKLRDVLFMCHAKPKDKEQEVVWKKLIDGTLESPDTWEVSLSAGKDKRETWERLLKENKLGALALLRNLRNMQNSKVPDREIRSALDSMKTDRVLPFRFVAAAEYAPQLEDSLEKAMFKSLDGVEKMQGITVLLVDISGSMSDPLSVKSEMRRVDAAYGLAILLREICESVKVYSFSNDLKPIAPRRGFALRDAIDKSQSHSCTYLGKALDGIEPPYDRVIVITDEQSHDPVPGPKARGYMINVASAKNGVGYGKWNHIDGFSEAVIDWIKEYEKL